jgi:hypothetical protein
MIKLDPEAFELELELELEGAEVDLRFGGRLNLRVDCNYPSALHISRA